MMSTEVTQRLYQRVMGENPSQNKGASNPVENVSWYDAVYFCNEMSKKCGYEPVYSVNGETDVTKWGYTPHKTERMKGTVIENEKANGFRLPRKREWEYAAMGGQNFKYSGSNNLDTVAWCVYNSGGHTHPVAQKKANGYGLYDMSGNVWEWVWDACLDYSRYMRGGDYESDGGLCLVIDEFNGYDESASCGRENLGFRVVRSMAEGER